MRFFPKRRKVDEEEFVNDMVSACFSLAVYTTDEAAFAGYERQLRAHIKYPKAVVKFFGRSEIDWRAIFFSDYDEVCVLRGDLDEESTNEELQVLAEKLLLEPAQKVLKEMAAAGPSDLNH